jgi:hypothetical protein
MDNQKLEEATERMLAMSTIDNPAETRILLQKMEANLPISVRFTAHGVKGLIAQGTNVKNKDVVHQVEKLMYTGDMGGILCNIPIEVEGNDNKQLVIISITHLKVDDDNPLADEIRKYQKKRVLAIAISNSGTRRAATKSKRKKKGFGT